MRSRETAKGEPEACWSCRAAVGREELRCPACGVLQPEPSGRDHFAVLGLPRQQALDPVDLERRFRERSRLLHPDRFARATARERRLSLERSTRLNDAYRVLRDPRRRAAYVLELLGATGWGGAAGAGAQDAEFLEEQLELREDLAAARRAGDQAVARRIAAAARERLAAVDEEVARLLAPPQPDPAALAAAARALARARYLESVLFEADPDAVPSRARDREPR